MVRDTSKNIKWIDGLRGVASFSVVCTHLSRAFDYTLFLPRDNPDTTPRVWQFPIIRTIFQGKVGVAIFALLTGYVCALKPLKLARAGKQHDALTAVAKSAFRRPPRLILPATLALIVAWTMAQFGGFIPASRSDSEWFRYASPTCFPTIGRELQRLVENFMNTWRGIRMEYDDHQWALLPFLKGSFIVFMMVAALVYTRFRFRVTVYFAYLAYWWCNGNHNTETFGQQMVFGTFLSDLAQHPTYQQFLATHPKLCTRASIPFIIFGLYLCSYPDAEAGWAAWSDHLDTIGKWIFPRETSQSKRWTAVGVDVVAFALQLNAPAKEMLSNRFFLWLGKNSFAVYLIHGTLLRTVLAWLVYGINGENGEPWKKHINEKGEEVLPPWLPRLTGPLFWIYVILWLGLVYWCAHLWTTYVDAWCGKLTKKLEDAVFVEEGEREDEVTTEKGTTGPLLG